jgi:hypothetical protein
MLTYPPAPSARAHPAFARWWSIAGIIAPATTTLNADRWGDDVRLGSACGPHGSAQMENPTKASTAKLRTMIAIAATSTLKNRLSMCHFHRQSTGGTLI